VRSLIPPLDYAEYTSTWDNVVRAGQRQQNLDAWAGGRRYLSLAGICLSQDEAAQLRHLTNRFGPLLDLAVDRILRDRDWWSALAWPWPATELAAQETPHPGGRATLYGRFDCLLDANGIWQVIEYNADTPSGGREATGLEPPIARLHQGLRRAATRLSDRLVSTLKSRMECHHRPVRVIGIVSSHSWLEDMAQATWLAGLLRRAGYSALVGDVTDLTPRRGRVALRDRPIDALYRFYPVERLYRHAIFASLCEASIDGRLLLLNGLRGFLAQSKACLAWVWSNRSSLPAPTQELIEKHLPATVLARDPSALQLLPHGVVKHVNGREGDSVVFGSSLSGGDWEACLLEGGYVVQRAVASPAVVDVEVDDVRHTVECVSPRYACVGAFAVGGRFAGCYTRLDGPVTSARARYAATLCESA